MAHCDSIWHNILNWKKIKLVFGYDNGLFTYSKNVFMQTDKGVRNAKLFLNMQDRLRMSKALVKKIIKQRVFEELLWYPQFKASGDGMKLLPAGKRMASFT